MEKAHSAIQLSLSNEVQNEVAEETTIAKLMAKIGEFVHDQVSHQPFVLKTTVIYSSVGGKQTLEVAP